MSCVSSEVNNWCPHNQTNIGDYLVQLWGCCLWYFSTGLWGGHLYIFCEIVPRGGPEDSKTPLTCEVQIILSQVMALSKMQCFNFPSLIFNQNYFGKVLFSLNCHNLAQNHPNFTSGGCFGILRTSSC